MGIGVGFRGWLLGLGLGWRFQLGGQEEGHGSFGRAAGWAEELHHAKDP